MRRGAAWLLGLTLALPAAEAGMVGLMVSDVPYAQVWAAALRAVDGYPLERAKDGVIATGWLERDPRSGEGQYNRVTERLTLHVAVAGDRATRVSVSVEALGRQDTTWVTIADTAPLAHRVLDRLVPTP